MQTFYLAWKEGLNSKESGKKNNLGVLIDNDLNFSSHIKTVIKSLYLHLKNINKLKEYISKEDLEKNHTCFHF